MKRSPEKEKLIVRVSAVQAAGLPDASDWERVDAFTDEELTANALSDQDNPPGDAKFFRQAQHMRMEDLLPQPKSHVSLRLDRQVLDWFKSQGKGYQTRINAVLKAYMEHQRGGRNAGL